MEKKTALDGCITLNLTKLVRDGGVRYGETYAGTWTAGTAGKNHMGFALVQDTIILDYRLVQLQRNVREHIQLSLSPCNFGGQRLYMHCPECGARVLKLYLAPIAGRFLCRSCGDLTYESQQDSRHGGFFDVINQFKRGIKEERRYYARWEQGQRRARRPH